MMRVMYHFFRMAYTLSQLARKIARSDDEDVLRTVERRISHWQGVDGLGLFSVMEIDIGPPNLGRGRVRQYPDEAVRWCKIWNEMAGNGWALPEMHLATSQLGLCTLANPGCRLLQEAEKGIGAPVFFTFDPSQLYEFAAQVERGKVAFGQSRTRHKTWEISRTPTLSPDCRAGRFLNLTWALRP